MTFTLTTNKAGTGNGTVTSSPGEINCGATCSAAYNSGTVVTLTAAPATDSAFGGWSGGGGSGARPRLGTLHAHTTGAAAITLRDSLTFTVAIPGAGRRDAIDQPRRRTPGSDFSA